MSDYGDDYKFNLYKIFVHKMPNKAEYIIFRQLIIINFKQTMIFMEKWMIKRKMF